MLRSPNRAILKIVISNWGIDASGVSLIKDFDQAQREYHRPWVAGIQPGNTPFVWSLIWLAS